MRTPGQPPGHDDPNDASLRRDIEQSQHLLAAIHRANELIDTESDPRSGDSTLALLRLALQGASMGCWEWWPQSGEVRRDGFLGRRLEVDLPTHVSQWRQMVHPDDVGPIVGHVEDLLHGRVEACDYRFRLRHRNGEWIWFHDRCAIVERDATGAPLRVSGTTADISAEKHAERDRARLETLLTDSLRLESLGRLTGRIAHDLNNFLTPILGHAELLCGGVPADEVAGSAQAIRNSALQARDLVRKLLAFSRRQVLKFQPVDLNDMVVELLRLAGPLLGDGIVVEHVLAPGLPALHADHTQLEQALLNLVINARDAMPRGGRLSITTRQAGATMVEVVIRDSGIGMDAATRARLFDPFFTTKPAEGATGLGLATAHGIVAQHEGTITVDSTPGAGATFTVRLPVSQMLPARPARAATDGDSPQAGQLILLVEDQPQVQNYLAKVMQRLGYRVVTASEGASAMALLAGGAPLPDALFTDMTMPGMTGLELHRRLCALYGEMPVVFFSGHGSEVLHGAELPRGAQFLPKPAPISEIARALTQALQHGPRRRAGAHEDVGS